MTAFRGTTAECFANYLNLNGAYSTDPKMRQQWFTERKQLEEFLDIAPNQTVTRWVKSHSIPEGKILICLRFFLKREGYIVDELEALDDITKRAVRFFALGKIHMQEFVEYLGYPLGTVGNRAVIGILKGTRGISPQKFELLRELVEKEDVQEKIVRNRKNDHDTMLDDPKPRIEKPPSNPTPTPVLIPPSRQPKLTEKEAILDALGKGVLALIPLAQIVESDQFTPEERARLRQLAGEDGVFKLANTLTRLCGERRRNLEGNGK